VFVPRYKLIQERGRNDTLKSLPWTRYLLSTPPTPSSKWTGNLFIDAVPTA